MATAMHSDVYPPATIDKFLTEAEFEDLVGYARGTAATNRARGRSHPKFIRIGERAIRYRLSDIEAWLADRTQPATK